MIYPWLANTNPDHTILSDRTVSDFHPTSEEGISRAIGTRACWSPYKRYGPKLADDYDWWNSPVHTLPAGRKFPNSFRLWTWWYVFRSSFNCVCAWGIYARYIIICDWCANEFVRSKSVKFDPVSGYFHCFASLAVCYLPVYSRISMGCLISLIRPCRVLRTLWSIHTVKIIDTSHPDPLGARLI